MQSLGGYVQMLSAQRPLAIWGGPMLWLNPVGRGLGMIVDH